MIGLEFGFRSCIPVVSSARICAPGYTAETTAAVMEVVAMVSGEVAKAEDFEPACGYAASGRGANGSGASENGRS